MGFVLLLLSNYFLIKLLSSTSQPVAKMAIPRGLLPPITSLIARRTMAIITPSAIEPATVSAPQPPLNYHSQWKRTTDVPLTRENFLDLLYGKTPTIRESGFLTPQECWNHERELSPQLAPYKHNTGPLLSKVGVAQFEYQAQAQ